MFSTLPHVLMLMQRHTPSPGCSSCLGTHLNAGQLHNIKRLGKIFDGIKQLQLTSHRGTIIGCPAMLDIITTPRSYESLRVTVSYNYITHPDASQIVSKLTSTMQNSVDVHGGVALQEL